MTLRGIQVFLKRVWLRQKSYQQGRRGTIFTITHTTDGLALACLTMEDDTGSTDVRWRDVSSIIVYKKDCWAVDQIRMYINLTDHTAIELTENMNGWNELIESMSEYLPGCTPHDEWWPIVAFPPFEANVTTIYERGQQVSNHLNRGPA